MTNTVWFSYTAPQNQSLLVDLSGTTYGASLHVLTDLGSGPTVITWSHRFDATAGRVRRRSVARRRERARGLSVRSGGSQSRQ